MTDTVRITSKRQITIPSRVYASLGLKEGEDLVLELVDNKIHLQKGLSLLKEMEGSIKVPDRLKGLSIEKIIKLARRERFRKSR